MIAYRISGQVRDYHRVKSLARREHIACGRLHWPLALAEDGSALVAAVGTILAHGLVIEEPFVCDRRLGRRAALIAYRLGEEYDRAMGTLGITAYYARVDPALSQFQYFLARLGFDPVAVPGDLGQWFRRETGAWRQVVDSSHAEPVDGLRQRLQAYG